MNRSPTADRGRWSNRRLMLTSLFVIAGLTSIYGVARASLAMRAGLQGKTALVRAEEELTTGRLRTAGEYLSAGESSFSRMRNELSHMGPIGWIARATPLVRIQLRGAEALADAGIYVSRTGLRLQDELSQNEHIDLATAIAALDRAAPTLDRAYGRVSSLEGYRLLWPLSSTYHTLKARLGDTTTNLKALRLFVGGSRAKRYLVFSQNPDEVRPTGGYIGTYGILLADRRGIHIERFDAIENWVRGRPAALIPAEGVRSPFRFGSLPRPTIANVNTTPDWPAAARLAADMWQKAGEQPVDGVISVTPGFLVRVLHVTGPTSVESYGETVTPTNVVERLDYHTHQKGAAGPRRKDFVAAVAQSSFKQLVNVPLSRLPELSRAVLASLESRELLAWAKDDELGRFLRSHRWDAAFPETAGDFFYNAEFSYVAKNGRGLKRTFDHYVDVRQDGSARIKTKITIRNTEPFAKSSNELALIYATIYGPRGARLHTATKRPVAAEPSLAGHPAAGWFISALPLKSTRLTVVWDAPQIVRHLPDGRRLYGLWWMTLPDHRGDVLKLHVSLPRGWRWKEGSPPKEVRLGSDFVGSWEITGR